MGRVIAMHDVEATLAPLRAAGRRIVLTNGCFDLLHVGHARSLQAARALGDVLVVGVNGDDSVHRLKGGGRPFVPSEERAELLAALACVDFAVVFPETTAERLAATVRPDVYVKGADYQRPGDGPAGTEPIDEARLPEAKVVRAHGGTVVLLPLTPGRSTTGLAARVRAAGHRPAEEAR